jgi:hypothetical protein
VERGDGQDKRSFWTRVGVAFENTDGSCNIKLHFYPTNPATTLQMRDFDARDSSET